MIRPMKSRTSVCRIGRSGTITLEHEHKCAQDAIRNLRNAYVELLHGFFSVAAQKFGDEAYTAAAQADDVCLLGRLRPRRPHRHRVDVFVQDAVAWKSAPR